MWQSFVVDVYGFIFLIVISVYSEVTVGLRQQVMLVVLYCSQNLNFYLTFALDLFVVSGRFDSDKGCNCVV